MTMMPRFHGLAVGLALVMPVGTAALLPEIAPAAMARAPLAAAPSTDQGRLLEDFLHYIRVARPALARSNGEALLDTGISDAELAMLVDSRNLAERLESTLRLGRAMAGVEDIVAQIESRVERGRQELSRDPARVREAVLMLVGTRRQQMLAEGRLLEAGEYAVPELLRQMVESRNPELERRCFDMLVRIRRQAVTPLSIALWNLDPMNQRIVSDILAAIAWPHAAPYLLQLAQDPSVPNDVRDAARRAHAAVGGGSDSLSEQWTTLARRHFDEEQSLVAFPGEATNNIWQWDDFVGLVVLPVPTEIYSEIMAMDAARHALIADDTNGEALALYVAANLKREFELPDGASDPVHGDAAFSPAFFATAAGVTTAERVLTFGLDRFNTPLIRNAIAALRQTAGNAALARAGGSPLAACLRYPDRRVQYEAALGLAEMLPQAGFSGDFSVVPLLASAVRTGDANFAVVLAPEVEDRQSLSSRLQAQGFTVINTGRSLGEIEPDIAAAPGVDLVVVRGDRAHCEAALAAIRSNDRTVAAPVLVVAPPIDAIELRHEHGEDRRVLVSEAGLGEQIFVAAVDSVMHRASGGRLTTVEAQQYAIEALDALRGVAVARSGVFQITDAENALIEALEVKTGGLRLLVAEVLAMIDTDRSQRRLLDVALASSGSEQIALLDEVAASARRFGNRLERRHVDALMDLISGSAGATADAAARVHGALDLPSSNAVRLITS